MNQERPDTLSFGPATRYQLLKELGRGGMGVVHLALAKGPSGFSKLVVLKTMRKQLVGDPESHRMFLEEARVSARLTHPNIVQVHEVCDYDGTPTMVMEYLEGRPLSEILHSDGLPAPRNLLIYVLAKTLAGLGAAHDLRDYDGTPLNLVHRDVSPHNVFVTYDGQVKVLDFGIAKAEGSEVQTRAGAMKGKVRYMPPEQVLQLPADRRIDIFTIGVILWECLVGRRFWGNASDEEVTSRLIARQLPSFPADTDVPADLATICARAIAPDREERYATAGRMQRDLEDHLARQSERLGADDLAVFMHYRFDVEQESAKVVIQSHVRSAESAAAAAEHEPTRVLPDSSGGHFGKALWRSKVSWFLVVPAIIVLLALAVMTGIMAAERRDDARRGPRARLGAAEGTGALCKPGFKSCDGACISLDRPDRGCGSNTCYACAVSNATPRCNRLDACDIAVCHPGFEDCNGDSGDGCETNVRTDPDNCGTCGRRCPPLPHAARGCGDTCTIWRCEPGYRDCNNRVADGCEVDALDDPSNCGACGHVCGVAEKCRQGTCR